MYKMHKELSPLKKTTQLKPGRGQDRHLSHLLQAGSVRKRNGRTHSAGHTAVSTSLLCSLRLTGVRRRGPTGSRGCTEQPCSDCSKPRGPSRGRTAGTGPPRTVPPGRRAGHCRLPTLALHPAPHPAREPTRPCSPLEGNTVLQGLRS